MCKSGYDIHLAANRISPSSVDELAALGFERDEFTNLTHCHTGEYHGTYHGATPVPDDDLWADICEVLHSDDSFSGYLEEERTESRSVILGEGSESPNLLPPVPLVECPADVHKVCDVHIGINLSKSTALAIEPLQRIKAASVDRPTPEGVRRVYTVTFDNEIDGQRAFIFFRDYLSRVPGLVGKIKMEKIMRRLRKPEDAAVLPIVTSEAIDKWFAAVDSTVQKV